MNRIRSRTLFFINGLLTIRRLSILFVILLLQKPITGIAQTSTHWWPVVGTLMLGGGGLSDETAREFIKRFIALAGGPDAIIVIIPTANPKADTAELRQSFQSQGAKHVIILNAGSRQAANLDSNVNILCSANAVFFTGGQSLLLENTYRGTLVEKELKSLLTRGGVVAGDSAGAIAIGCMWLTWLPDPYGKRTDDLCLLPAVAVSPHASAAKGYSVDEEVLKYLGTHPGIIGIDIDENTMLILNRASAETIGKGRVSILDVSKDTKKPTLSLAAGEKLHLE